MLRFSHRGIIPFPQNSCPDSKPFQITRDVEAQNIDKEVTHSDEEETILYEGVEINRIMNGGFKDNWHKLMEDASKPMYGTCRLSHLTTILLILNLKMVHGWKNDSVDELLELVH